MQYSLEQIVAADPDVIVLGDHPFTQVADLRQRDVWKDLRAVKEGRVYAITDPSLTNRPGPRLVDGLEELARYLHPELFGSK